MPHISHAISPSAPSRRRYLGRAVLMLAGLGALFGLAGAGLMPCPVAALFRVPCPGCGSTRSMWALLALDVPRSLRFHALAPFAVAITLPLSAQIVFLIARDGHPNRVFESRVGRILLGALMTVWLLELAYWMLRFFGLFGGPCPLG